MNQNLKEMEITLYLGHVLGKLGLIDKYNMIWSMFEDTCHKYARRSIEELESSELQSKNNI